MLGKDTFARLLATENITIKYHDIPTAAFSVEDRELLMPNFAQDASKSIVDLLLGHEVGHALYTYPEGYEGSEINEYFINMYKDIDSENYSIVKDFFNVVEDARIEKLLKSKFPGMKSVMYRGYKEFWDKNFFGVKDTNLNELGFIDRLNIHYKMGTQVKVGFNEIEESFLSEINHLKSFNDLKDVVSRIYSYAKDEHIKTKDKFDALEAMIEFSPKGEEGEEGEKKEVDTSDTGANTGLLDDLKSQQEEMDLNQDKDEEESETGSVHTGGKGATLLKGISPGEKDFGSITMKNFEHNVQKKIHDTSARKKTYLDIPNISLEDTLDQVFTIDDVYTMDTEDNGPSWAKEDSASDLKPSEALDILRKGCPNYKDYERGDHQSYYDDLEIYRQAEVHFGWQKYKDTVKQEVNYLVRNFLQKMKAKEYQRTRTNYTGDINLNKLWAYKIDDKIFKQVETVLEGKNHAFVMFIDWSSSMTNNLSACISQVLKLCMFCRKLNIPFEVYSFTDPSMEAYNQLRNGDSKDHFDAYEIQYNSIIDKLPVGSMQIQPIQLVRLFDSNMKLKEFEEAAEYVYKTSSGTLRNWNPLMDMRGTPLNSVIVHARNLIDRYRKITNADIMNVLFLTDGDSQVSDIQYKKTGERYEVVDDVWSVELKKYVKEKRMSGRDSEYVSYGHGQDVYLTDKDISKSYLCGTTWTSATQQLYINLMEKTGCNLIGMYAISGRVNIDAPMRSNLNEEFVDALSYNERKKYSSVFRRDGCLAFGSSLTPFDEFYIITLDPKVQKETVEDLIGSDKRKIRSFFKKNLKGKLENRIVLDRFINTISQHL